MMTRLKIKRKVWTFLFTITLVACNGSYNRSDTPIPKDIKMYDYNKNDFNLNDEQQSLFNMVDYFSNNYPYKIDKIERDLNTKFSVTQDNFINEQILTPNSNPLKQLNIELISLRDIDNFGQVLNIKFEKSIDIETENFIEIVKNDGFEFKGLFSTQHLLSAVSKTTYNNNTKKEVWIIFDSSNDLTKVVELTFWSPKS